MSVDEFLFCFFFQAEDGIRDTSVTGVQTCALPIYLHLAVPGVAGHLDHEAGTVEVRHVRGSDPQRSTQIGRASCRERVQIEVVAVSGKKKKKKAVEPTNSTSRRRRGSDQMQNRTSQ